MTRVGVLETGRSAIEAVHRRHGDYPQLFRRFFAAAPELEFQVFHISSGHPMPALDACDAWLITGSPAGVYEDHPWLPPLRAFVRQTIAQSIPTLGICFGHQLMAQALGGTVVKSDKGRGLGIQAYTLTEAGQRLMPEMKTLNLPAMHQDQVVELPPNATILAGSDFCPYAALSYGEAGLSFQPHPEFTVEVARDTMQGWQDKSPIAEDVFRRAEASFDALPSDAAKLAPVLAGFLTRHAA